MGCLFLLDIVTFYQHHTNYLQYMIIYKQALQHGHEVM